MTAPGTLPAPADALDALEQLAQYGTAPSGAAHLIDVGSAAYLEYFEREVLEDLVLQGGATLKVYEGAYGGGKTHLLHLLANRALSKGMAVVRAELSNALSFADWRLIARHILQNIELQADGGSVRSLPGILDHLARNRGPDTRRLKGGLLPHQGFARAMTLYVEQSATLTQEARELLTRFLQGEAASAADLKRAGVTGVKQPLPTRNAELVVKTVLAGLRRLGVAGTLLLFDENEKTLAFRGSTPPRKVTIGANLLRRLIDASAAGTLVSSIVVFAVLPGFIQTCSLAYPALGQRLSTDVGTARSPGWRSPVISIQAVSTDNSEERFVEAIAERIAALLANGHTQGSLLAENLRRVGHAALESSAGSGYRRVVLKAMSTYALSSL